MMCHESMLRSGILSNVLRAWGMASHLAYISSSLLLTWRSPRNWERRKKSWTFLSSSSSFGLEQAAASSWKAAVSARAPLVSCSTASFTRPSRQSAISSPGPNTGSCGGGGGVARC
ncbi:hypothetical protein PR202_ga06137 [Eleusine coracana subsp. coracana]|uniref:Uncharacterized protein n=1 Tax=Eleusine coracana subsp. coracana TaxID=191504 RepID=A0AAV5BU99_ELECO|nr:hypothetical protein PR202_ga06137 [Eleusine coracana subsp. coracana]